MTSLMSGLSIPMPNATVATTTLTEPVRKPLCVASLCDMGRPAW